MLTSTGSDWGEIHIVVMFAFKETDEDEGGTLFFNDCDCGFIKLHLIKDEMSSKPELHGLNL